MSRIWPVLFYIGILGSWCRRTLVCRKLLGSAFGVAHLWMGGVWAGLDKGQVVLQLREGLSQFHKEVWDWDDFQRRPHWGEWFSLLLLDQSVDTDWSQEAGINNPGWGSSLPAKDTQRNDYYGGGNQSDVIVWDWEATSEWMVKRRSFKCADIDLRPR